MLARARRSDSAYRAELESAVSEAQPFSPPGFCEPCEEHFVEDRPDLEFGCDVRCVKCRCPRLPRPSVVASMLDPNLFVFPPSDDAG